MKAQTVIKMGTGKDTREWRTGDGLLMSATLTLNEGKTASNVKIQIHDPVLELATALPLPIRKTRVPVEVWFGYGNRLVKVFSGYYSILGASGLPGQTSITAVDKAKGMRRVSKSRNLTASSLADLFTRLAKEAGLKIKMHDRAKLEKLAFSSVIQDNVSDWETVTEIAEETGLRVYVRNDTLYVGDFNRTFPARTVRVEVADVNNGFTFDVPEFRRSTTPNIFDQAAEKVYNPEDLDNEAAIRYTQLNNVGLVLDSENAPGITKHTQQRALSAQAKARKVFTGSITLHEAFPALDVSDQIILGGFGARFSGAWNISSIRLGLTQGTQTVALFNGGSNV